MVIDKNTPCAPRFQRVTVFGNTEWDAQDESTYSKAEKV